MTIEAEPDQLPQEGKLILMSRECASMVSTWNEYLCIERAGARRFSLSTCGYEVLGSVHDLIPAAELFDEDGEMVIPETLHGQPVALEDGEYLVGETLVDAAGDRPAQFGLAELDVGLQFCQEIGWTQEAHFLRVWRRVRNIVRLDGDAPVSRFKPWLASHQSQIDRLVDEAAGRRRGRRGFKRLGAWVERNDWDALVDDGPGGGWIGMAVDLLSPYAGLSDGDLRDRDDHEDLEDRDTWRRLSDADRIRYARSRLADLLREGDTAVETVHACPLSHSEGGVAFLCGVARSRGQAGPEFEWHGAFISLHDYLDWLPSQGLGHEDDLGDLTDAQILGVWRRR